jgi:uncharacterized protein YuzE
VRKKKLRYHYDREADVMYFYFDRPRKAKTVELDNDFILRLDPASEAVVGMTVMSFSRHLPFLRGRVPGDGEVETNEAVKALLAA